MARFAAFLVLCLMLTPILSCGSNELSVAGRVLVDDAPMDSGTLRLDPLDGTAGRGVGGAVTDGVFAFPAGQELSPGRYRASVIAFKKTGRTVNDYQRGAIEETVQVSLRDSPKEVVITPENSTSLEISFTSRPPRQATASGHAKGMP